MMQPPSLRSAIAMLSVAALASTAAGHSSLISPMPRNAIDRNDPRWEHGMSSPDIWQPGLGNHTGQACACVNGTSPCDIGQTCLWMSVGCSLGCAECDGGQNGHGGTNPNARDRCNSGKQPWLVNNPLHRTFNRECTVQLSISHASLTHRSPIALLQPTHCAAPTHPIRAMCDHDHAPT